MNIRYRNITSADYETITEMIFSLYNEDPGGESMSITKIQRTFSEFQKHPHKGSILIFDSGNQIVGYAILIDLWSNEWGGNVLNIDELYIIPEFRGKGIATNSLEYLAQEKMNEAVVLQLETTPDNEKARKLYERLGFLERKNGVLVRRL